MSANIDWTFLISLGMTTGAGLAGYWLWLRERRRTLPGANPDLDALKEENARFQAEIDDRLESYDERIDFVERRLIQSPDRPRLPDANPATPE
jgi:hypothetical protein